MPVFIDRHEAPGVTLSEAVAGHELDVAAEAKHGCRARTFWLDETRGVINCLVEAPSREMVLAMHAEAHGQLPSSILEVQPDVVLAFLGRLDDLRAENEHSTPVDSAYRTIMFTDLKDSTTLTAEHGDIGAMEFLRAHDKIVRSALARHMGREVKHTGDGIMASFTNSDDAVRCAIDIRRGLAAHNVQRPDLRLYVRLGLAAGEPVVENNDLFGASVQLAARICAHAQPDEALAAKLVRDACADNVFTPHSKPVLKGFAEPVDVYAISWRSE